MTFRSAQMSFASSWSNLVDHSSKSLSRESLRRSIDSPTRFTVSTSGWTLLSGPVPPSSNRPERTNVLNSMSRRAGRQPLVSLFLNVHGFEIVARASRAVVLGHCGFFDHPRGLNRPVCEMQTTKVWAKTRRLSTPEHARTHVAS